MGSPSDNSLKRWFLSSRTVDISESGMSALLPVKLQVGQTVELRIKLPGALATGRQSCETEMSFVMALSFCNRCMMSSGVKQPTTARTAAVRVTYCKPWTEGRESHSCVPDAWSAMAWGVTATLPRFER